MCQTPLSSQSHKPHMQGPSPIWKEVGMWGRNLRVSIFTESHRVCTHRPLPCLHGSTLTRSEANSSSFPPSFQSRGRALLRKISAVRRNEHSKVRCSLGSTSESGCQRPIPTGSACATFPSVPVRGHLGFSPPPLWNPGQRLACRKQTPGTSQKGEAQADSRVEELMRLSLR